MKITDGKAVVTITREGDHWKVDAGEWEFLCDTRAQAIEKALVFLRLPATISEDQDQ